MQAHGGQHEEVILPPFVQVPVPILASTNTYPHADVLLDNCSSAPVKLSTFPIFDNSLLPTQTNFPALPVIFLNDSTIPEEQIVGTRSDVPCTICVMRKVNCITIPNHLACKDCVRRKESCSIASAKTLLNQGSGCGIAAGRSKSFVAEIGNGMSISTPPAGVLLTEMYR